MRMVALPPGHRYASDYILLFAEFCFRHFSRRTCKDVRVGWFSGISLYIHFLTTNLPLITGKNYCDCPRKKGAECWDTNLWQLGILNRNNSTAVPYGITTPVIKLH